MYLKHLHISGFKSFAKKSELVFDAPITAIVGPNGSGKSNVAEAFRFVLGEQSVKSMRGKKGEDLIFNGTEQVSRANRAAVAVTLNNTDRVFPLEYDEIVVERTVHRDGQNEYSINGSKVRLRDVQELLAAANIGPSGHHIISQGEADRILSSSPKERREMIEDALGLKVYQFKKQEAEKKLKKTRDNIERVQSLRREVAPHLKFLEKQMQKLAKQRELSEQIKSVYAEYLKREDVYLAHNTERVAQALQTPQSVLTDTEAALEKAKAEVAAETPKEMRAAVREAEKEVMEARRAHEEATRAQAQHEGQVTFLERRIETTKQQAADHPPVPYKNVKEAVQQVERTVAANEAEGDSSKLQRALQDVVSTLRSFLKSAERETPSHESEEKELAALKKEQSDLEKKVATTKAALEAAQKTLESKTKELEAASEASREAEREVFRLENEKRDLTEEIRRLEYEQQLLERERADFKQELQEAVALIGRSASAYYDHTVLQDGKEVTESHMAAEARSKQQERRRELEKLKIRLEEVGGSVDDVEGEYKEVKERDEFLVSEIADLEASATKLEDLITDLTDQLNEQFGTGIEKIGREFNQFFTLMFGGGSAKLERITIKPRQTEEGEEDAEEEQPTAEGIELSVSLPNKKVSGLDMLSGGERALTSIALIFAMSQVNPPLFVILDETDAALDEANSRRYGDMIEALAKRSQLILITHNRETMSRAGVLYGVTMAGDGVSKLLSVKFDEAAENAKA